MSTQPPLCAGDEGIATSNVTGGTAPYAYSWSTTETDFEIKDVAGPYTVTVTDVNGCTAIGTGTITEPAPIAITSTSSNPSCLNDPSGGVTITISGGTPTYQYTICNSLGNDIDSKTQNFAGVTFNGLKADDYTIKIKDANGCQFASAPITVGQHPQPVLAFTASDNIICASGEPVDFTATETSGLQGTFEWFVNGSSVNGPGATASTEQYTHTPGSGLHNDRSLHEYRWLCGRAKHQYQSTSGCSADPKPRLILVVQAPTLRQQQMHHL